MYAMRFDLKELNWANYLIELLIVILGISIAFSIDRCAERQREQKETDKLVRVIEQEFKEDLESLGFCNNNNKSVYNKSKEGIRYLQKSASASVDSVLFYTNRANYFETDFNSKLPELVTKEVLKTIDFNHYYQLKAEFDELFNYYGLIEIYEQRYDELLNGPYKDFWNKNYNFLKEKPTNSNAFFSDEYQNILLQLHSETAKKQRYYKEGFEQCQKLKERL